MGFGEVALLTNQSRAATIKCLEDCEFATMSKKDYLKILAKLEQRAREELIEFF